MCNTITITHSNILVLYRYFSTLVSNFVEIVDSIISISKFVWT